MRLLSLASMFLLIGFAGAASAAMPNAKPGLWESTATTVIEAGLPLATLWSLSQRSLKGFHLSPFRNRLTRRRRKQGKD
jgi:hypothetical protein